MAKKRKARRGAAAAGKRAGNPAPEQNDEGEEGEDESNGLDRSEWKDVSADERAKHNLHLMEVGEVRTYEGGDYTRLRNLARKTAAKKNVKLFVRELDGRVEIMRGKDA